MSGETLRELAALLAESGPADRPAALREGAGAYAQEARGLVDLRAAARRRPDEAREQLTAAASALAGTPLAAAVRRWAARLARRHVQPAPLFSIDEGLPGPEVPWPERLERASVDAFARDVNELAARFDQVPAGAVPLLARRLAQALPDDRRRDALALLERAADRDRSGPGAISGDTLLALAAERLIASADRELALDAWRLVRRARSGARRRGPPRPGAAAAVQPRPGSRGRRGCRRWPRPWPTRPAGGQLLGAVLAAAQAGRRPNRRASPWWRARRPGRPPARAASPRRCAIGPRSWTPPPDPTPCWIACPPAASRSISATIPASLPATCWPRPTIPNDAWRAAGRSAATGGSALRVTEAAGWLIEAGKPAEALSWLMDAGSHGERSEALSLYLRRLVRQGDAASQATVLSELLEALPESTPAMERAELEMLRAEALAMSGAAARPPICSASCWPDRWRATPIWRCAGCCGPCATARPWSRCGGTSTTPSSARAGCAGAAAALVEKARVVRDLRGDAAAAAEELRQALEEDPEQPLARVMWLAAMPPLADGPPAARGHRLVEALARELPASAVSLHFLAALLAEGQGGPHGDAEAARRNLAAAVERAGKALPITLARRHVAAEQNRTPPEPGLPELLERQAERIAGHARGRCPPGGGAADGSGAAGRTGDAQGTGPAPPSAVPAGAAAGARPPAGAAAPAADRPAPG